MAIDPTNVQGPAPLNKQEQNVSVEITKEDNLGDRGIPEAGQTSEVGPAVVTNISVSTLETSRAVNAPEQSADANDANDAVEQAEKGQNPEKLSMIDKEI